MTDALRKLIEAVEAGRDDSEKWEPALGTHGFEAMMAFHGRLDSAKALHDSLLPGWEWEVRDGWCGINKPDGPEYWDEPDYMASSGNPARSWLLAILKAKLVGGS